MSFLGFSFLSLSQLPSDFSLAYFGNVIGADAEPFLTPYSVRRFRRGALCYSMVVVIVCCTVVMGDFRGAAMM